MADEQTRDPQQQTGAPDDERSKRPTPPRPDGDKSSAGTRKATDRPKDDPSTAPESGDRKATGND